MVWALTDAHSSGGGPCGLYGMFGWFCLAVIESTPLLAKVWVQPKLEAHHLKKSRQKAPEGKDPGSPRLTLHKTGQLWGTGSAYSILVFVLTVGQTRRKKRRAKKRHFC